MIRLMIFAFILTLAACTQSTVSELPAIVIIPNQGGNMEGHTPTGFEGQGAGLFIGDNLNSGFPEGVGLQTFITFDLGGIKDIDKAILKTTNQHIRGTPFEDLGKINIEVVSYDTFSSELWDLESEDIICSIDGYAEFICDVTPSVLKVLREGEERIQFKIYLEKSGDDDGSQDLVMFYIKDNNTNEPGIFELKIIR